MNKITTGVSGLDEITNGGFISGRSYLISGSAGTGKTTLGFHFLNAGLTKKEKCLLITLGEGKASLKANAQQLGFDFKDLIFLDLSPEESFYKENEEVSVFSPDEIEAQPLSEKISEYVEKYKPQRILFDSMTMVNYMLNDLYQYRKYILSFLHYISARGATLMICTENSPNTSDEELEFLVDGVIRLENNLEKRFLYVSKFRGSSFRSGKHAFKLGGQGVKIFPQLLPEKVEKNIDYETISSGVPEIDEILSGGIERGTSTILTGPSGVGKTTLGLQFMKEAAGRGERSVIFTFEEAVETLVHRSKNIRIPVHKMLEKGTLVIYYIEPLRYSADEFARMVKEEVEKHDAQIVMLDSLSGYKLSVEETAIQQRLHALISFLKNKGVTSFLVNEMTNITGEFKATDVEISYLADNIIFLRYIELQSELKKTIGVLKKRLSDYQKSIREFMITQYGIKVGPPLLNLENILSGRPTQTENTPNQDG